VESLILRGGTTDLFAVPDYLKWYDFTDFTYLMGKASYAVVITMIRLRLDGRSTDVQLLIKILEITAT